MNTTRYLVGTTAIFLVSTVWVACDGTAPPSPMRPSVGPKLSGAIVPQATGPRDTLFPADIPDGYVVVDQKGRRWVGKPIRSFAPTRSSSEESNRGAPTDFTDKIDTLSDVEFAKNNLPVRAVFDEQGRGAEYVAESLPSDVEDARRAREKRQNGTRMASIGPGKFVEWTTDSPPPLPPSGAYPVPTFEVETQKLSPFKLLESSLHPQAVFGTDTRWWAWVGGTSGAYGQLASALFVDSAGGWWGSGTMVGAYTAVTMAHVFWNRQIGNWSSTKYWNVGRIRAQAGASTMTSGYTNNIFGCYWVNVPQGFKTGSNVNWYDDYAAIDLGTCGYRPGNTFGYLPMAYSSSADDYWNSDIQNHGYDGASPLPPNPQSGWTYNTPSIISRWCWGTGCSYLHADMWEVRSTNLDQTGAMSGSGGIANLFRRYGGPYIDSFYVTGVWGHWDGDETVSPPVPATYNSQRKLDSAFVNFVASVTSEW